MQRAVCWVSGAGLVLFLAAASWLALVSRDGPPRGDAILEDGTPVTIHLPGAGPDASAFRDVPGPERRPPVVLLMHGFAGDRVGMGSLARRLARSGYAVMSFDAPGHGTNRNPFTQSRARPDSFFEVFSEVVDFARSYPFVDGSRMAVGGHSMGAAAALDYATRDSGLDATLLISGGKTLAGPYRPPNALFLVASGEPLRISARSGALATRLAKGRTFGAGTTVGDHLQRTAVRLEVIDGTGHVDVVQAEATARQIVRWLDATFGLESEADLADPRLAAVALAAFAMLLCVPGLGLVVGRLAPARAATPSPGPLALPALALALLGALPLVANGTPLSFLSVEVGDVLASHFSVAGIGLLLGLALTGRLDLPRDGAALRRSAAVAGIAVTGVYVLLQPISSAIHSAALTPERVAVFAGATLALLPLALAFQALLRRGPVLRAALLCGIGRLLLLGSLGLGIWLGLLPPVLAFMMGALLGVYLVVELLAAPIYAISRDHVGIAFADAALLAMLIAVAMPVRI